MNIKVGPKEVWFQTGFTVQIGISYFRKKKKKTVNVNGVILCYAEFYTPKQC